MMSPELLGCVLRAEEKSAQYIFDQAVGEGTGPRPAIGRYQAHDTAFLRSVIEEADAACPRAADLIRQLLQNRVIEVQRLIQNAAPPPGQAGILPEPVFRYTELEGDTREEMRANARDSKLAEHGDVVMIAINEGDLFRGDYISGKRPAREDVAIVSKLAMADFPQFPDDDDD